MSRTILEFTYRMLIVFLLICMIVQFDAIANRLDFQDDLLLRLQTPVVMDNDN